MQATITIRPHGVNGGFSGSNSGKAGTRAACVGWSVSSARSNMRFLRSIEGEQLPTDGVSFTLTLGVCPPTASEWTRLRKRLATHLGREMGAVCWHHVTEWQERGVPHLHGIAFFENSTGREGMQILKFWLSISSSWKAGRRGQHFSQIESLVGWLEYMSKHASRGFKHYQRDQASMPKEWANTGRMWGRSKLGWPLSEDSFQIEREAFFKLRRLQDRFALSLVKQDLARARFYGDAKKVRALCKRAGFLAKVRTGQGVRSASETRGLNEWIPENLVRRMVQWAVRDLSPRYERIEENDKITLAGKFNFVLHRPDDGGVFSVDANG
jgi:hypothetical protein